MCWVGIALDTEVNTKMKPWSSEDEKGDRQ